MISAVNTTEDLIEENLILLEQSAVELLDFDFRNDNIYHYISEKIRQFSGASIVVVNSIENDTVSINRSMAGISNKVNLISSILGFKPENLRLTIQQDTFDFLLSGKLVRCPSVYDLSLKQIPKVACNAIENIFQIGEIYQAGFSRRGNVFGGTALLFKKGQNFKSLKLLQAFIKQVAIVLQNKRSEDKLRESELRYRNIFENTMVGIYRSDEQGNILLANPSFYKIFGYSNHEDYIEDKKVTSSLQQSENRKRIIEELRASGITQQYENIGTKKNGNKIYYIETLKKISGNDKKNYYEGSIIDITKRKEMEIALITAKEKAYQIAWTQSHKVRRPLSSIMGLIDLMKIEKDQNQRNQFLEMMATSCNELDEVIREIIALTGIEDN